MKLISKFSFLTVALLSIQAPSTALAQECKCDKKPEIVDALKASSTTFVGRAEKVRPSALKQGYIEVKFKILKRYKDLPQEESPDAPQQAKLPYLFVYTSADQAQCGYNFREGYDYLVYASGTPANLKTDTCSRTAVLDYVLSEVKTIESMVKKKESADADAALKAKVKSKSKIITNRRDPFED